MMTSQHRKGMLLIVIVGLAAILLSLSVGFLARMRADARESEFVANDAQARIMLHAAMNYIQETSRLGWHDPDRGLYPGIMRETFGWTDVRGAVAQWDDDGDPVTGTYPSDMGPIDQFGRRVWSEPSPGSDPVWPAPGSSVRCPMHVHQRPPFAIQDRLAPNPLLVIDPEDQWRDYRVRYDMDRPPVSPVALTWPDFAYDLDDPAYADASQARAQSVGLAWFRIYREAPSDHDGDGTPAYDVVDFTGHHGIFIVTCGAGGSLGFKDWPEVDATVDPADQPFDQMTFEQLRASERLLWYRVEWAPAVLPGNHSSNAESGDLDADGSDQTDTRVHKLFRRSEQRSSWGDSGTAKESEVGAVRMRVGIASAEVVNSGGPKGKPLEGGTVARNPVGTIQWIQRLETEPPAW